MIQLFLSYFALHHLTLTPHYTTYFLFSNSVDCTPFTSNLKYSKGSIRRLPSTFPSGENLRSFDVLKNIPILTPRIFETYKDTKDFKSLIIST